MYQHEGCSHTTDGAGEGSHSAADSGIDYVRNRLGLVTVISTWDYFDIQDQCRERLQSCTRVGQERVAMCQLITENRLCENYADPGCRD